MNKLWKSIRRLGTGIMLLAACAFVFHTAAVAADFGTIENCNHAGVVAHQHGDQSDAVPAGSQAAGDHVHLVDAGAKHADQKPHGHCKVPCCGTGCTTAVLAIGVNSPQPRQALSMRVALPPASALSSASLNGFKRPPRPLAPG